MSSDKHKQAKNDLLRELETLRAQLDDPASAELSEEDIPLLLDRVEKAVASAPDLNNLENGELEPEEVELLRQAYQQATRDLQTSEARLLEPAHSSLEKNKLAVEEVAERASQPLRRPHDLHAQQSLFEPPAGKPAFATPDQPPARPRALGENPFLPKHIRERLQERRKALADHIAEAATFFPGTNQASGRAAKEAEYQAIVDELVAEYLPRLEAELRERLMKKLQQMRREPGANDGP